MDPIVNEKLEQAVALLQELDLDLWLTFARETSLTPDPCLDLIAGVDVTWHSAFLVSRSGERIAIVGRFDADNVWAAGAYQDVLIYDQSIRPALRAAIERLAPASLAVNYSESDPAADGLTHGMWRYLQETLADSPYAARLVSAEKFIAALRGRKSTEEIKRIRAAIRTTEKMFQQVGASVKPGLTELEIAARMHALVKRKKLTTAWDAQFCPIVNAGPDSSVGHAAPAQLKTARGQLLHMDFGIRQDGYCSDLQRMWYVLDKREKRVPGQVQRAWEACWGAVDAAAAVLKPGVPGWQVDAAARTHLVAAGFPEYQHALGHHLGRKVHDGSTLLGPRWDRYGQTPYGLVEAGNVFTLELGVRVPGRGDIALEEDVLVKPHGLEFLSRPQREIWLV